MGITASTKDRSILSSAARTATTNSPDIVNYDHKGIMLLLNVTANPGGVVTLLLSVEAKIGGVYRALTAFTVTAAATNANYAYTLLPGAAETAAIANHEVQALPIPRVFRVTVTHSAAGSWTYAVDGVLLP